jgi:hypothetical protein
MSLQTAKAAGCINEKRGSGTHRKISLSFALYLLNAELAKIASTAKKPSTKKKSIKKCKKQKI